GHEAQVMLSTAKVTVRSPASAAGAAITALIRTNVLRYLFMGGSPFGVRREATMARRSRRRRRLPRARSRSTTRTAQAGWELGACKLRHRSRFAAASSRRDRSHIQEASRRDDEQRLPGRKRRQIADPGAANAETEQDQRHDAAGRGGERANYASGSDQALPSCLALRGGPRIVWNRCGPRRFGS